MRSLPRLIVLAVAAALPAACARLEPPPNPFAGGWATAERQQITFRDNTIVVNPPDAPQIGRASCRERV